jgi:hypothetical protein
VRISESAGDEKLVSVEVVCREMPDVIDTSVIEVRALRVLGNEEAGSGWIVSEGDRS